MTFQFKRFLNNDDGATAIEYALIAGIISIGIIASVSAVSGNLQDTFDGIAQNFTDILS
ncbi:MAG: Flp family type IVb pilin [Hyphomicrobium sp.]|nr:MAG: Flp family type IVb pilin [Hyphomicrobium sp.]PPC99236.1 MAG: Flp family type IVb pilin [Hyphomicrobium sp.]